METTLSLVITDGYAGAESFTVFTIYSAQLASS